MRMNTDIWTNRVESRDTCVRVRFGLSLITHDIIRAANTNTEPQNNKNSLIIVFYGDELIF